MVKEAFRRESGVCLCPPQLPACVCGARTALEVLTRRPHRALGGRAARAIPRSRSARLRVAEKLAPICRPESWRADDDVPMTIAAYAQAKRVENLHLTRERDRRRGRELATFLLAGLPVACALLAYAALHIETVRVGYLREARQKTMCAS